MGVRAFARCSGLGESVDVRPSLLFGAARMPTLPARGAGLLLKLDSIGFVLGLYWVCFTGCET